MISCFKTVLQLFMPYATTPTFALRLPVPSDIPHAGEVHITSASTPFVELDEARTGYSKGGLLPLSGALRPIYMCFLFLPAKNLSEMLC